MSKEQWYDLLLLQDSAGATSMAWAALQGQTDVLQFLLNSLSSEKRYEVLKSKNPDEITTLILTAYKGNVDVMKTIAESISEKELFNLLEEQGENGTSVLHIAASRGHKNFLDCTHNLLSEDQWYKLLNIQDNVGNDILIEALQNNHTNTAQYLIESLTEDRAYNVIVKGSSSVRNVLQMATSKGLTDFLKFLFDLICETPEKKLNIICGKLLFLATREGHAQTVEYLLGHFSHSFKQYKVLSSPQTEGKIGLHFAALYGHSDTISSIFKFMSKLQVFDLLVIKDDKGVTAIEEAAMKGRVGAISLMLNSVESGDVYNVLELQDEKGKTALHFAAKAGYLQAVTKVTNNFLSVEQRDKLLSIKDHNGCRADEISENLLEESAEEEKTEREEESGASDVGQIVSSLREIKAKKRRAYLDEIRVKRSFEEIAKELQESNLKPTLTLTAEVKSLYDTNHVYRVTSPRGFALIINNKEFDDSLGKRYGSEIDVRNTEIMLKQFDFVVHKEEDLGAKEMLTKINQATIDASKNDYGTFFLIIMSHGRENDCILGKDGNMIDLNDVYYMLSSHHFRAMSGRPKFIAVQACSGVHGDYGNKGKYELTSNTGKGEIVRPELPKVSDRPNGGISGLATDDLLVIKSCFNTYASSRSTKYGSPFITSLVHNFYEHAWEMDVREICDMVQEEVRAWSVQHTNEEPEQCFGQTPFCFSMLTDFRMLHLFPGHNGENCGLSEDFVDKIKFRLFIVLAVSALVLLLAYLFN